MASNSEEFSIIRDFLDIPKKRNKQAMDASTVFSSYVDCLKRSDEQFRSYQAFKKEAETKNAMEAMEAFEARLASDPQLKSKLAQTKRYLIENPDVAAKADPAFIAGLNMFDFGDDK